MTPQKALMAAIRTLLVTDPDVAALIDERVYDEIPEDDRGEELAGVAYPYLYAGPVAWTDVDMGAGRSLEIRARLFAVSADFDRDTVWAVADAVTRALHRAEPEISAPYALASHIRAVAGGDVLNPPSPKAAFVDVTATITLIA